MENQIIPALPKISLLPAHLVDQIKAGEVVEGPSSLLKELLENSIDAQATRINMTIRQEGLELIRIQDNGNGMGFEDLPWAFRRHATSKISQFSDLYRLQTFGFRGEALAAIASVARVVCSSQPLVSALGPCAQGGQITIHGGHEISHLPWADSGHGTTLNIQDLFFNTPARLKFIRSQTAEKNALKRVINAFLLAHWPVTFSLQWDDKEKILFPAGQNRQERIHQVFFGKKEQMNASLLATEKSYEQYKIEAYFDPASSKGSGGNKCQYLYVNGRVFTDKSFQQVIAQQMSKMWPDKSSGQYVLFLTTPPSHVDVNCHPNKMKIKFARPAIIYSLLQEVAQEIQKKYLQAHSDDEHPPITTAPSAPAMENIHNEEISEKNLFSLHPGAFFLHFHRPNWWLIHWPQCFAEILTVIFTAQEGNIPLLVGIPLPQIKEYMGQHLHLLEKIGLHLDQVAADFWILRALPWGLESFPYQSWIVEVLQEVSSWPQEQTYSTYLSRFIAGALHSTTLKEGPNLQQWEKILGIYHQLRPNLPLAGRKILDRASLQELFP